MWIRPGKRKGSLNLRSGEDLREAAQFHAAKTLSPDFYARTSLGGDTVRDRYIDVGGSRWELMAEHIAKCAGCTEVPDIASVERLHDGWINSQEQRRTCRPMDWRVSALAIIIDSEQGLYAVQTFTRPPVSQSL